MTTAADPSAPIEGEDEADTKTRLPRVVVRMSQGMFDALTKYCQSNDVLATSLGRTLIATEIGWDLASDPDAPGSATRTRYASAEAKESAKERNRAYSRLLRKALMQAHLATTAKKPLLTQEATNVVRSLSTKPKAQFTTQELTALDTTLNDAVKAGK